MRTDVTLEIGRPVSDVFSVLCDARAWPTWARWAREVVVDPPGPVRVGSELRIARRGLGLGHRVRTVTDMRPDRLIAIENDSGSVRLWIHLEPVGERARVTASVELRSGGWLPIVRRFNERARMRAELKRLKALVEASTGGRPAPTFAMPPATSLDGARQRH